MSLFRKLAPPQNGASKPHTPPRVKYYTAQTGYVYEYFVERGQEGLYTFQISWNRTGWTALAIHVPDESVRLWEMRHERVIRAQERYAAAKLALFALFDETQPGDLPKEVLLTPEEVDFHLTSLGL